MNEHVRDRSLQPFTTTFVCHTPYDKPHMPYLIWQTLYIPYLIWKTSHAIPDMTDFIYAIPACDIPVLFFLFLDGTPTKSWQGAGHDGHGHGGHGYGEHGHVG